MLELDLVVLDLVAAEIACCSFSYSLVRSLKGSTLLLLAPGVPSTAEVAGVPEAALPPGVAEPRGGRGGWRAKSSADTAVRKGASTKEATGTATQLLKAAWPVPTA